MFKLKKILITLFIISIFISIPYVSKNIILYKNSLKINKSYEEKERNKHTFKNRLVDDVIIDFENKFNESKFDISKFENQEVDNSIYLYSQLFNMNDSYFIIQYNGLDVISMSAEFNNAINSNYDDIVKIIEILIRISDNSISEREANQMVINMFKEFENNKDIVILRYPNNIEYSLSIVNNDSLRLYIK